MMLTPLLIDSIEVVVYRDDLNHTTVSGNKLHKLKPNIELAKKRDCNAVLSFGGPYSNHLHALAWACKEAGLSSIGVVRGELHKSLTPTLLDCQHWGMTLVASSRTGYRECQNLLSESNQRSLSNEVTLAPVSTELVAASLTELNNILIVPEGGSNLLAIESLANAYKGVFSQAECRGVTHVVCATGTGATLAGVYKASPEHVNVIGVQAVAEKEATLKRIQAWLGCDLTRLVIKEGHLGRFAKITPELNEFINDFELQNEIPLDPVYTGKAMLKVAEMVKGGYFKSSDKILFVHTGGLQGKRGVKLG